MVLMHHFRFSLLSLNNNLACVRLTFLSLHCVVTKRVLQDGTEAAADGSGDSIGDSAAQDGVVDESVDDGSADSGAAAEDQNAEALADGSEVVAEGDSAETDIISLDCFGDPSELAGSEVGFNFTDVDILRTE